MQRVLQAEAWEGIDGLRVRQRPGASGNVVTGLLPLNAQLEVVMGPIPTEELDAMARDERFATNPGRVGNYAALRVASSVLGGSLFNEIRTRRAKLKPAAA